MIAQYLPVLLAFAFAAAVAGGLVGVSALFGRGRFPKKRGRETYESGMPLLDSSRKRISVKFFVVAMVFIVFDVEIAFLFPWAVALRDLVGEGNGPALASGFLFLLLLAIGYIYLWREGVFDWSQRGSAS
jgi:NADH-quinone oxidoreductase subunit A